MLSSKSYKITTHASKSWCLKTLKCFLKSQEIIVNNLFDKPKKDAKPKWNLYNVWLFLCMFCIPAVVPVLPVIIFRGKSAPAGWYRSSCACPSIDRCEFWISDCRWCPVRIMKHSLLAYEFAICNRKTQQFIVCKGRIKQYIQSV